MIRYDELMIGDHVLVNGEIRKVVAITKKKVGYHKESNKNRLFYALLRDVNPVKVSEVGIHLYKENTLSALVEKDEDGDATEIMELYYPFKNTRIAITEDGYLLISNIDGEMVKFHNGYLHELQHKLNILFPNKKNIKKNLEL